MMKIIIARQIDLSEVVEIDKAVIGTDWRKKHIERAIEENRCLVAKTDSKIVGFLLYNTEFYNCSFIELVIIHPLERNKGYAKSLITTFEKNAPTKKVFTSTNQSNEKMQRLFDSIGYIRSGFVDNLDEGDPELIYFKELH